MSLTPIPSVVFPPAGPRQDVEIGRVLVRWFARHPPHASSPPPLSPPLSQPPASHKPTHRDTRMHTGRGTPGRTKTAAASAETPLSRPPRTAGIPATSRPCVSVCAHMRSTCSASTSGSRPRARAGALSAGRRGSSRQRKSPRQRDTACEYKRTKDGWMDGWMNE